MSGETTGRPRVSDERLAEKIKRGTALAAVYESLAGRDSEQAFALAVMLDLRDARALLRRAREALRELSDSWASFDASDATAEKVRAVLAALDEETK